MPVFRQTLAALVLFAAPVTAQDLAFTPDLVQSCLAQTEGQDQLTCVGLAAEQCMAANEGGYSTAGMNFCTGAEADYWDGLLNAVYKDLSAQEKAKDEDMAGIGATAPKTYDAMREMQRAWIPYRDGLCAYEYSQWGGGTGGGPAYTACILTETARQIIVLRSYLNWGE
jgi:uncharacterized protein YecT (DUF1311 family)